MEEKIIFTSICKHCNKKNEVAVPKKHVKKLTPRYCAECGRQTKYNYQNIHQD